MTDLVPLTLPTLSRRPDVELVHVGTWSLASGETTFTADDLRAAVTAQDCPAVRRPILKLGHTDPRFDGEPAAGYVANLRTDESAHTLRGDYAGMPGWLGDVLASAYPDRSIEATFDFVCQIGHTHPFVVTAVALLGVTEPGVGTLASLQDIAERFGVSADVAATSTSPETAHRVAITVSAAKEASTMPNPTPRMIAASASVEDVRRAFYDSPAGQDWSAWIEEIQLDPLQLIVINDATGQRTRTGIIVDTAKDGSDAVSFGEAVPVVVRYEDAPAPGGTPASVAASRLVWASRRESRVGVATASATSAPAANVDELTLTRDEHDAINKALGLGPATDGPLIVEQVADLAEVLDGICERLGIRTGADGETILAALDEVLAEQVTAAAAGLGRDIPSDAVVLDPNTYRALTTAARERDTGRADSARQRRETLVTAAVREGRIPPAGRQHWMTLLEADPAGESTLASLPKGLVPLTAQGHADNPDVAASASDQLYEELFGRYDRARKGPGHA